MSGHDGEIPSAPKRSIDLMSLLNDDLTDYNSSHLEKNITFFSDLGSNNEHILERFQFTEENQRELGFANIISDDPYQLPEGVRQEDIQLPTDNGDPRETLFNPTASDGQQYGQQVCVFDTPGPSIHEQRLSPRSGKPMLVKSEYPMGTPIELELTVVPPKKRKYIANRLYYHNEAENEITFSHLTAMLNYIDSQKSHEIDRFHVTGIRKHNKHLVQTNLPLPNCMVYPQTGNIFIKDSPETFRHADLTKQQVPTCLKIPLIKHISCSLDHDDPQISTIDECALKIDECFTMQMVAVFDVMKDHRYTRVVMRYISICFNIETFKALRNDVDELESNCVTNFLYLLCVAKCRSGPRRLFDFRPYSKEYINFKHNTCIIIDAGTLYGWLKHYNRIPVFRFNDLVPNQFMYTGFIEYDYDNIDMPPELTGNGLDWYNECFKLYTLELCHLCHFINANIKHVNDVKYKTIADHILWWDGSRILSIDKMKPGHLTILVDVFISTNVENDTGYEAFDYKAKTIDSLNGIVLYASNPTFYVIRRDKHTN